MCNSSKQGCREQQHGVRHYQGIPADRFLNQLEHADAQQHVAYRELQQHIIAVKTMSDAEYRLQQGVLPLP